MKKSECNRDHMISHTHTAADRLCVDVSPTCILTSSNKPAAFCSSASHCVHDLLPELRLCQLLQQLLHLSPRLAAGLCIISLSLSVYLSSPLFAACSPPAFTSSVPSLRLCSSLSPRGNIYVPKLWLLLPRSLRGFSSRTRVEVAAAARTPRPATPMTLLWCQLTSPVRCLVDDGCVGCSSVECLLQSSVMSWSCSSVFICINP